MGQKSVKSSVFSLLSRHELTSSNNNTESDSKNTSDDILGEVVNNKENTSDGKEEI